MLIVSYDFEDDKTRTKFARLLEKYGHRLQYSVWEIKNSPRVLQNLMTVIELEYKKLFSDRDSILIFSLCEGCKKKIKRYGYARFEESDLIFIDKNINN